MWRTHLLVALRSMARDRLTTIVNVFGLSLGIASLLLIGLQLRFEWTMDHFHPKADRVHRIVRHNVFENGDGFNTHMSALLKPELDARIPAIEASARTDHVWPHMRLQQQPQQERGLYADPEFFDIFHAEAVAGDPAAALADPSTVVVTETLALRYFTSSDVIGETIVQVTEQGDVPLRVGAVIKSWPENSRFNFDIVLPFQRQIDVVEEFGLMTWGASFSTSWALLAPGTDRAPVVGQIESIVDELTPKDDRPVSFEFFLQPLKEVHLALENPGGLPTDAEARSSLILLSIGLMVLLIAAINFTMLTIGRASTRLREVGVRKALGAGRPELLRQFGTETGTVTFAALLFGLLIAELTMPLMVQLTGNPLALRLDGFVIALLAGLWLVTTVVAGLYPALVQTSLPAVAALRKRLAIGGGRSRLRHGLVFVQVALTFGLVAVSLTMGRQLSFLVNRDLGFSGEQVVEIPCSSVDSSTEEAIERLRLQLANNPGVLSVTGSQNQFGNEWTRIWWEEGEQSWEDVYMNQVDGEFLETLGIDLIAGRAFDAASPSDQKRAVIVNEQAVEYFEWGSPEQALGQQIPGGFRDHEVIGVVADFHYNSLREHIRPLVLLMDSGILLARGLGVSTRSWFSLQRAYLRLAPENLPTTLRRLEGVWMEAVPDHPYELRFLDDELQKQYEAEQRWGTTVTAASGLAMVIAALGLLGMATMEVAQRTKEIGIRKALGASAPGIVLLLSRPVTILVLLASALVTPFVLLLMNRWLDGFAYRIPLGPLPPLAATAAALLLAWLTVGLLAWRAARANPVQALRYE